MSTISLSPNTFFSREVSSARLQKLVTCNREQALRMGLWDQFKDLFYSQKKEKFLSDMYDFIHNIGDQHANQSDIDAIKEIIRAAPPEKVADFFHWKDGYGRPLLHSALKTSQLEIVKSYKNFLGLLSAAQCETHLDELLAAKDAAGTLGLISASETGQPLVIQQYAELIRTISGDKKDECVVKLLTRKCGNLKSVLHWALENRCTQTVAACKPLLELLPIDKRWEVLSGPLTAKDEQGTPGLVNALANNHLKYIKTYQSLLELLPQELHEQHLFALLSAKDADGNSGLAWALKNRCDSALGAYQRLLPPLPHSAHLNELLVAAILEGVPGLVFAIKDDHFRTINAYRSLLTSIGRRHPQLDNLLTATNVLGQRRLLSAVRSNDIDHINAYTSILEIFPESMRAAYIRQLLAEKKDIQGKSLLQLAFQHGNSATFSALKKWLELLPQSERSAYVYGLLESKDKMHPSGLLWALRSSDVTDISTCQPLLQLLTNEHRHALLTDALFERDPTGAPPLVWALKTGNARFVRAYTALLELLPAKSARLYLPSLLREKDAEGNPGLSWALERGHTGAIIAYKKLLQMLPEAELIDILAMPDQNGDSGLRLALECGAPDTLAVYKSVLELIPVDQYASDLNNLLLAENSKGIPWYVCSSAKNKSIGTLRVYESLSTSIIPKHSRSQWLSALIATLNKLKPQLLFSAVADNDAAYISAYTSVLKVIPEPERVARIREVLAEKDDGGNSLLQRAFQNGNAAVFQTLKEWLELLPQSERRKYVLDLLGSDKKNLFLAVKSRKADAISACAPLLELLTAEQRDHLLIDALGAHDSSGTPALADALNYGEVKFIYAYKILLALLSEEALNANLLPLLRSTDRKGNPGLAWAMENGKAEAIIAFKDLLQMLPEHSRIELLAAVDQNGDPGLLLAMAKGYAAAITAYGELLKLIPQAQRMTHLPSLLAARNRFYVPAFEKAFSLGKKDCIAAFCGLLEVIPEGSRNAVFEQIFFHPPMSPRQIFNHLDNEHNLSLLSCIHHLNDEYREVKLQLMVKIATTINTEALCEREVESMMDIWGRSPEYMNNPVIFSFIVSIANTSKLVVDSAQSAALIEVVRNITDSEPLDQSGQRLCTFMLKNNGFFVQLIAACANHTTPAIKEKACALYDEYLDIPALKGHRQLLREGLTYYGIRGAKNSDDETAMADLDNTDSAYLFVKLNTTKASYDGLILSKNQIAGMLNPNAQTDWSAVAFVTNTAKNGEEPKIEFVTGGSFNPRSVYSNLPLFKKSFQIKFPRNGLSKLLGLINLKYTNSSQEPGLPTYDYTDLFNAALASRTSATKLTTYEHQCRLHRIFGRFLTEPGRSNWSLASLPTITDQHVEAVLQSFGLSNDDTHKIVNARTLFCLAAILVRLSSDSYFGQSYASPVAIRFYAAGLLNKAYQLHPEVCKKDVFDDYMNRLLSLTTVLDCTATLSTMMVEHTKGHADFNDLLLSIKPVSWK